MFDRGDMWGNITRYITTSLQSFVKSLDVKSLDDLGTTPKQPSEIAYDQVHSQIPYSSGMIVRVQQSCRNIERFGFCRNGDSCQINHDSGQQSSCFNFMKYGRWNFGDSCKYLHDSNTSSQDSRQGMKRPRSPSAD